MATTIECRGIPRSIRYWWDRALKLWTITIIDEDENQIGSAEYAPNREVLALLIPRVVREAYEPFQEDQI